MMLSGTLITERVYEGGKFACNTTVTNGLKTNETAPSQVSGKQQDKVTFNGTGMHTVFNLSGKVEKKGFFVNGKLFTGELYLYDDNNNLIKVIHYHNGTHKKTEEITPNNTEKTT